MRPVLAPSESAMSLEADSAAAEAFLNLSADNGMPGAVHPSQANAAVSPQRTSPVKAQAHATPPRKAADEYGVGAAMAAVPSSSAKKREATSAARQAAAAEEKARERYRAEEAAEKELKEQMSQFTQEERDASLAYQAAQANLSVNTTMNSTLDASHFAPEAEATWGSMRSPQKNMNQSVLGTPVRDLDQSLSAADTPSPQAGGGGGSFSEAHPSPSKFFFGRSSPTQTSPERGLAEGNEGGTEKVLDGAASKLKGPSPSREDPLVADLPLSPGADPSSPVKPSGGGLSPVKVGGGASPHRRVPPSRDGQQAAAQTLLIKGMLQQQGAAQGPMALPIMQSLREALEGAARMLEVRELFSSAVERCGPHVAIPLSCCGPLTPCAYVGGSRQASDGAQGAAVGNPGAKRIDMDRPPHPPPGSWRLCVWIPEVIPAVDPAVKLRLRRLSVREPSANCGRRSNRRRIISGCGSRRRSVPWRRIGRSWGSRRGCGNWSC